jgi:hypothetical protein
MSSSIDTQVKDVACSCLGNSSCCIVWKHPSQSLGNIWLPIQVRQIILSAAKTNVHSATAILLTCSFISLFSAVHL